MGEDEEPAKEPPNKSKQPRLTAVDQRRHKFLQLYYDSLESIDDATAKKLLDEYGRLVTHLAGKFHLPNRSFSPVQREDLIAVGHAVLLQSWVCYDPNRNMKFSSWAARRIWHSFAALVNEARGLTEEEAAGARNGIEPTARPVMVDLDEPVAGSYSRGETLELPNGLAHDEAAHELEHLKRWLRERMRDVLNDRERRALEAWMVGTTIEKIAEGFGVTRQRADQIVKRGIEKLTWTAWDDGVLDQEEEPANPPADLPTPIGLLRHLRRKFKLIAVA